jgi:hypothetical protein
MPNLRTITVTGDEKWLTHTGDRVNYHSDLTAQDVLESLNEDVTSVSEQDVAGLPVDEAEALLDFLPELSDEGLQFIGDLARRVNYRREFLPTRNSQSFDVWRDLRYLSIDEWDSRYDRVRNVGPVYETDGYISSTVEITERLLPDYAVEISTYYLDSTELDNRITGEVTGDTYEDVKYTDGQGMQRRISNKLMWTIEGTNEFGGEKFLLGPIGSEDVLLFHWNDYNDKWDDPRVIGEVKTWPTKYLQE